MCEYIVEIENYQVGKCTVQAKDSDEAINKAMMLYANDCITWIFEDPEVISVKIKKK